MRRVLPRDLIAYDAQEGTYVVERKVDIWYDAAAFEDLVERARTCDDRREELLEEALAIYRGPYMTEVYAEWADDRRRQLHREYVDALVALARIRIASGNALDAIDLHRKALAEEPFREDLHRALMEALDAAGRRAEALRHYEALVDLLQRELNTSPAQETETLFRSIASRSQIPP